MKILKNIFSDIPMFFEMNGFNGDVKLEKDVGSIRQSIKNVILTILNERPFDSEFGTNLYTGLFENPEEFAFQVENAISIALERYETRIKLLSLKSNFSGRTLNISIEYNIKGYDIFDSLSFGINTERFLSPPPPPEEPTIPFQQKFDVVFKYLMYRYEPGWSAANDTLGKAATLSFLGVSGSLNPFEVGGPGMTRFQIIAGPGTIGASAGWFDIFTNPRNFASAVRTAYRPLERARSPTQANLKFVTYYQSIGNDLYYDLAGTSNSFYGLGGPRYVLYPNAVDNIDPFRTAYSRINHLNPQLNYDNCIQRCMIHSPYGSLRTAMAHKDQGMAGMQRAIPWITNRYSGEVFLFDNYLNLREETTLRDLTSDPSKTRDANLGVLVNGVPDIHLNKQYSGLTFLPGYFGLEQKYGGQNSRSGGHTLPVTVGPPWIPFPIGMTLNPFDWFNGIAGLCFDSRTLVLFNGATFGLTLTNMGASSYQPANIPAAFWPQQSQSPRGLCFEFGKRVISQLDQLSRDWGDKMEFIAYIGSIPYGPIIETFVPLMFYKDPTIPGNTEYFKWRLDASVSHWKEKFKSPFDGFARVMFESGAVERTLHQYQGPGYTAWTNILPSGASFVENIPVSWARDQYNYTFGPSGPNPDKGVVLGNETFGQYNFKWDEFIINNKNTEQSRFPGDPNPMHWSLDEDKALDHWTSLYNILLGQRKWGLTYTDSIWKKGVCGSSTLGEMYSVELFAAVTEGNGQAFPFYYNTFLKFNPSIPGLEWKTVSNTSFFPDQLFNTSLATFEVPWYFDRRFRLLYHYPIVLALNMTVTDWMHVGQGYYTNMFGAPFAGWFDKSIGLTYHGNQEFFGQCPVVSQTPFPNRKSPLTPPRNTWTGEKSTSHFELLYCCMKGGITSGLDSLHFTNLYNQLNAEGATGFP